MLIIIGQIRIPRFTYDHSVGIVFRLIFRWVIEIAVPVILGPRADDIRGSACPDPVEQLVSWRRETTRGVDEVRAGKTLDERCAGFSYLGP